MRDRHPVFAFAIVTYLPFPPHLADMGPDPTSEEFQADVTRLRDRAPGADPVDPYAEQPLSELPQWWQEAIRLHREFDLRPYKPPRFSDGQLKYDIVSRLEDDLDVTVEILGINVSYGDDWVVRVDGEPVCEIGRRRDPNGYTVFEMESDQFSRVVRDTVG